MTDDIVTRLRLWASVTEGDHVIEELHKAADEIERLRADVMYWRALPYCSECGCGTCQDNEQVFNNE
jgi:hypothetical protein